MHAHTPMRACMRAAAAAGAGGHAGKAVLGVGVGGIGLVAPGSLVLLAPCSAQVPAGAAAKLPWMSPAPSVACVCACVSRASAHHPLPWISSSWIFFPLNFIDYRWQYFYVSLSVSYVY